MPTGSKQVVKDKNQWGETDWVVCPLSDEQKAGLKNQKVDPDRLFKSLEGLVAEGFKFTMSWDERSQCFGCYLTAPKGPNDRATRCLSARAPEAAASIMVLMFKHFTLLGEDWGAVSDGRAVRDSWG